MTYKMLYLTNQFLRIIKIIEKIFICDSLFIFYQQSYILTIHLEDVLKALLELICLIYSIFSSPFCQLPLKTMYSIIRKSDVIAINVCRFMVTTYRN